MKTVGDKLGNFAVTGVKPGALTYALQTGELCACNRPLGGETL